MYKVGKATSVVAGAAFLVGGGVFLCKHMDIGEQEDNYRTQATSTYDSGQGHNRSKLTPAEQALLEHNKAIETFKASTVELRRLQAEGANQINIELAAAKNMSDMMKVQSSGNRYNARVMEDKSRQWDAHFKSFKETYDKYVRDKNIGCDEATRAKTAMDQARENSEKFKGYAKIYDANDQEKIKQMEQERDATPIENGNMPYITLPANSKNKVSYFHRPTLETKDKEKC